MNYLDVARLLPALTAVTFLAVTWKNDSLRAKTWIARSKTGYCGGFLFRQTSSVLFEIWSCTLAIFRIVSGALSWCRTKPDSATRSGRRKRSRCALESAAARRNRPGGLGRYLSVPSASCGLGCRAQIAIKTCRLELTEKRIWVSCSNLISKSSYLFICLLICAWVVSHYASVWVFTRNLSWIWTWENKKRLVF